MMSSTQVFAGVAQVVEQSLNADLDDIRPGSKLQADLGAESIDFLDITFRLERKFGITLSRGDLFPECIFNRDPEMVQDGRVTDHGIAELRAALPYAEVPDQLACSRIGDLFTVGMVAKFVEAKLSDVSQLT
jgi:acyl carrier protein